MTSFKKLFLFFVDIVLPESDRMKRLRSVNAESLVYKYKPTTFQDDRSITTLFSYRDSVIKDVLWSLKYERHEVVATLFSEFLYGHLLEILQDKRIFQDLIAKPCLIPIPITRKKKRERGYNQVELIIAALMKHDQDDHFTYSFDILERTSDGESQARTRDRHDRMENIRGAFRVKNTLELQNKDVFLIDDVITTGATLREARQKLLEGGARAVTTVALAH